MKNKITLFLIMVIASSFRLYHLGSVPIELNRDEASIGYTAYSLLKTGADEYGKRWPLNLESFGDWKLPVYEWATIPSIALFGLSAWSVRLPSAITGIISIYLLFLLVQLIVKSERYRKSSGLLAAGMLAISPWHIHFSRMAYEANLGLSLFLVGIVLFLQSIKNKRSLGLLLSGICFGLTMITYHAFQLVTPLFLILLFFTFRKELFASLKHHLPHLILFAAIVTLPVLLLFMTGLTTSNQVKLSGLSIFEEQTYYQRLFTKRQLFSDNQSLIAKLYTNIPVELLRQILVNSTNALNPDFLFINGGGHGSHDISGIGKFYSVTIPFLILGAIGLFSKYALFEKRIGYYILLWLVIGLLPALITWQPAHATRSYVIVIPLLLLFIQGWYWFLSIFSKRSLFLKSASVMVIIFILLYQVFSMATTYFLIAPQRDVNNWTWYAQDMVKFIEASREQVDHVYIQGYSWSPYIYYLFYAQIAPEYAQSHLTHVPVDIEGFHHVSSIDTIQFGDIPYQHLLESGDSYALFAPTSQLPVGFTENPQQFELYQMFSKTNSKESYVAIRKK